MKIELDKDVEKLVQDIETLRKAVKAVISAPEFRSLFGKTQFLDSDEIKGLNKNNVGESKETSFDWTDRRTRGDHSINVAAMATTLVEKVYVDSYDFEEINEGEVKNPVNSKDMASISLPQTVLKDGIDANNSDYIIYSLNKKRAMLLALLSGYAHDLGHTPFGHDGERAISEVYKEYQKGKSKEERKKIIEERREIFGDIYEENLGHTPDFDGISSFEHIEQSYINFLNIINREGIVFSDELLETVKFAILAHSRSRVKNLPTHIKENDLLPIHAIRTADKGDYQIVDGAEMEKLVERKPFNSRYSDKSMGLYDKINYFIDAWAKDIEEADELSDDMNAIYKLKQYRKIYDMWAILYCEINQTDINSIGESISIEDMKKDPTKRPVGIVGMFKGNKARNKCIVKKLMKYYLENYDAIPTMQQQMDTEEAGRIKAEGSEYESFDKTFWEKIEYTKELTAIGFVTSLTNKAAKELYEKLVQLRIAKGKGYGIEPIRHEEIDVINKEYTLEYINKMYQDLIGDELSDDEKRGLELKLRKILLENKILLNESLTDKGLIVIGRAKTLRIAEQRHDEELYAQMLIADKARETGVGNRLKYRNLNNNNNPFGSNSGR